MPRKPEWEKGPAMESGEIGGLGEETACADTSRLLRSLEEGRRGQPCVCKGRKDPEDANPCWAL